MPAFYEHEARIAARAAAVCRNAAEGTAIIDAVEASWRLRDRDDFRRKPTKAKFEMPSGNGSSVWGRANGIKVIGQLTGGGGNLTSVYPCTMEFIGP